ncbi:MAG: hypothetical protein HC845_08195 [Akkermansiaceae bacterium]|nr:hypothetical protein [Akkermansiaceae bacterium]
MNPPDLADATARALDLLPPEDPAVSDPRFLRNPALVEEARLTREAAADVWLAVSPLHVAPPELLHDLLEKINPAVPRKENPRRRFLPWFAAASGWAAAVIVAFYLWPRSEKIQQSEIFRNAPDLPIPNREISSSVAPVSPPISREKRLHQKITQLQNRLAKVQNPNSFAAPRVWTLSAPGAARRSPEEARKRVQVILSNALRSTLEAERTKSSDLASLVIERGWLPEQMAAIEDGAILRHRNFPEHSWQELNLLRSEAGEYYDASRQIVWMADPEGRGFIGKKPDPQDDLERFKNEPPKQVTKCGNAQTSCRITRGICN